MGRFLIIIIWLVLGITGFVRGEREIGYTCFALVAVLSRIETLKDELKE